MLIKAQKSRWFILLLIGILSFFYQNFSFSQTKQDDENFEDEELELNQQEIRNLYHNSLGLSIGTEDIWQSFGGSFAILSNKKFSYIFSLGSGKWILSGYEKKRKYNINAKIQAGTFSFRYFVSDVFPVFIEASLSYLFWQGRLSPAGGGEANSVDELAAKLDSGFNLHGPALSIKISWQYIWKNGAFIENCLVGGGKSFYLSETLSSSSDEAKSAVRNQLANFVSWGLINLSIGKYF